VVVDAYADTVYRANRYLADVGGAGDIRASFAEIHARLDALVEGKAEIRPY
jgi:hypothetical protein